MSEVKTWQDRLELATPPYVDPEEIHKAMLTQIEELQVLCQTLELKLADDRHIFAGFHHLLNKRGWHPGRTDDDLVDILDGKLEELRAKNDELCELYGNTPIESFRIIKELRAKLAESERVKSVAHDSWMRAQNRVIELEAQEPDNLCPGCGHLQEKINTFCESCGKEYSIDYAAAGAAPVRPWPTEEQPDGTINEVDPADMGLSVQQKPISECGDGEIYARISALATPQPKVPEVVLEALQSCVSGGYRDIDGDWVSTHWHDSALVAKALIALEAAPQPKGNSK